MKIKKALLFFCFFCSIYVMCAQNTSEKIALSNLFIELEKNYNIKFSFSDDDIKAVYVNRPKKKISLTELISYLNSNTLLHFKTLDNKYITVSFLDKKINICGKVLDSKTQEPLLLAAIKLDDFKTGTTTDNLGNFSFDSIPLNAILNISFVGYYPKKVAAKNLFSKINNCSNILLKEKTEELSEISIPKFLTSGLQKNTDGSTVLNTEKFGILPGLIEPDILKTIKILPGVESVNESISNINVRGGTNDQNLMLWDGIKMYHTGHFFGLISAYNPYLTKEISVSKNGTSSQFSDGVSSTINMKTDTKINTKLSGGAGFNFLNADAFLKVPIRENMAFHVSGRRAFTDFLNTPTYTNYFDRSFQENSIASNDINNAESNFYFFDYSFKFLYDLNYTNSIRANFIHIKNDLNYREDFTDSNNNTVTENSNLQQENIGANIFWQSDWNSKFTTSTSFFFSNYTVNSADYNRNTDQLQTQLNEVLETEFKIHSTYNFNNSINLYNGLVFNEIGVRNTTTVNAPNFTTTKKDVLLKTALYSEVEYKNSKTYARLGVRANYFHKFSSFLFESRINIRQQLTNEFSLKLEGEFKNQTTSQRIDFEDNFLGIEKRRWILANEQNIPIIKSKQASLGVEFYKDKFLVDVTAFYKKVDGITAANQGFYNNVQTLNSIGNYEIKGVEFLANKNTKNYITWLSYTLTENNYNFSIFNPSSFSNTLDITHSFSSAFNYNFTNNIRASLGVILRTGTPYTKPVDGNETLQNGNETIVNYDNPNTERLPNFFRFDASASYNFNFSESIKASLRFGITNLTNRKNRINSFFIIDNNSQNKVRRIDTHSLPFTPNLSFRVWF